MNTSYQGKKKIFLDVLITKYIFFFKNLGGFHLSIL